MKIFSPTISGSSQASGSLTISGSLTVSQGITGSLLGTASWATNTLTASFLPVGTYNITSSWAQSASNAINARTASFVNNLNQNLSITGAVILSGSPSPELRVIGDTQFTGSVNSLNGFTGSLLGTSSWATNTLTASFLPVGTYNITSSWATNSISSSLATRNLLTASVSLNTITFTKGDGSTFNITVNTGSGGGGGSVGTLQQVTEQGASTTVPITASIVSASSFTGSLFGTASRAITASYALSSAGGGGSFSLAGATDVSFSALADGDLIRYNGTAGKWQNTNLGLSLTPTLSAIEGGYFGGYTKITNWGSYSDPLAKAFVKSGSTIIITCSVDSSGQITWSDSNSNYNFTRSLEVQVQDFGDIVSEITTASYVKQTASFRYYRWFAVSASSNVLLNDFRFYSGSAQSSTAFPANMTSNTAPTPYVASASSFYVGYEPWEAFDSDVNSQWWNLAAPPYQGAFVSVDMGSTFTSSLRSMRIQFGQGFQNFTMANIQGSNDNTTWTLLHTITNVPANNVSTARNFG